MQTGYFQFYYITFIEGIIELWQSLRKLYVILKFLGEVEVGFCTNK